MNDREKTSIRTVAGHPPLREVVCAVNFSLASAAAARTAMGLVQAARGRLTLLHVMEPNPHQQMVLSGGEALRYLNEYEARAAMASERLMRLVPSGDRGLCRVEPLVVSGMPHQMILRAASEAKADLIVMGATSRSLAEELLLGSTARSVLRRARCPVLVVPGPAEGEVRDLVRGRDGGASRAATTPSVPSRAQLSAAPHS
jgi:nucleotide-binding universal stress UspA family protein